MRFTATNVGSFPSPPSLGAASFSALSAETVSISRIDPRSGIKKSSVDSPSGATSIIIPGTKRLTILLEQLLISWSGLRVMGHFEIRTGQSNPVLMYQSGRDGHIILPCFGEQLFLSRYGLRAFNNSLGGNYAITAYYTIMEV
jgi:hypothetical protein